MHSKDFSLLSFITIASYHLNHYTTSTSHCPHDLIKSQVILTLNINIHNLSSSQWPTCKGSTSSYCHQPKKCPLPEQMLPLAWRNLCPLWESVSRSELWVPLDYSKGWVLNIAFGAELIERSLLICPHDTNTKMTGRQADGRTNNVSQETEDY